MGYRDVQTILSYSARDMSHHDVVHSNDYAKMGFQENGAGTLNNGGLTFNHYYGFGLVDARAAVRLAETWAEQKTYHNLDTISYQQTPNVFIAPGDVITREINVTQDMDIEKITLFIDLDIDDGIVPWVPPITLISPDGTRSVLKSGGYDTEIEFSDKYIDFTFSSVAHWGESSLGTWTIEIDDSNPDGSFDIGTGGHVLDHFELTFWGSTADNNDTYFFNDDYNPNFDGVAIDNNGGIDTINAAMMTRDIIINLSSSLTASTDQILVEGIFENAYGGDGHDVIFGNDQDNALFGGRGDDILSGGAGSDYIDGSDGIDTVSYAHSVLGAGVNLAASSGWHGAEGDQYYNIENVIGSDHGDNLIGTDGINLLEGGAGNDVFYGMDGDDTLHGSDGNDVFYGMSGNDVIWGGDDHDILYGNFGDDTLNGGDGDDILNGGEGSDHMDGADGIDTVSYADFTRGVGVQLDMNIGWNGAKGDQYFNIENIIGSSHDDILVGTNGINLIEGGAGDDAFYGMDGNDMLYGADGSDKLFGMMGDDVIWGGDDNDMLYGNFGHDILNGEAGSDILNGGGGKDGFVFDKAGYGTGADQVVDFNAAKDYLDISDILDGFYDETTDDILDFVNLVDNGTSTSVWVDQNGGADNFSEVVELIGYMRAPSVDLLISDGTLII